MASSGISAIKSDRDNTVSQVASYSLPSATAGPVAVRVTSLFRDIAAVMLKCSVDIVKILTILMSTELEVR
jgi:hypothetical protein